MSSLKPLILHAHNTGPNPFKVAILLEMLSIPYETRLWQFGDDPKNGVKGAAFLAINENGRVPALEDPNTGVVSWESGAVVNYVLRVYDTSHKLGPPATGGSEQARVDFDKWVYFLVSTLGPMMGQATWFGRYNAQKNQDAVDRYVSQSLRCFDVLEGQLMKAGSGFVLPGGFSAVDAHFYPWVSAHEFTGVPVDKYPSIQKWLGTVRAMDAVKAAYEKVPAGKKM